MMPTPGLRSSELTEHEKNNVIRIFVVAACVLASIVTFSICGILHMRRLPALPDAPEYVEYKAVRHCHAFGLKALDTNAGVKCVSPDFQVNR